MSKTKLQAMVEELVSLRELAAEVADEIDTLQDAIKADMDKQIKLTDSGIIDASVKTVTDYAVNGADLYAKHMAQNTPFKKVWRIQTEIPAVSELGHIADKWPAGI